MTKKNHLFYSIGMNGLLEKGFLFEKLIAFTSSIDNNLPPFSLNLCCMAAPTPFSNEDMTSSTSA